MKKTSLLIATALLSLLTGCSSSPKVSADYSEAYDFTQIKNYYLVPVKNQSDGIGLAEQRITKGIEQYLSQKNIAATEKNKADIWISYYLTSKDKTKVRNYNTSFSYGYSRNYRYVGINMCNNVDIQHYT